MVINGRTDLACEAHSIWKNSADENSALSGVKAEDIQINGVNVIAVEILDRDASEALRKPIGKYYTLELSKTFHRGSETFENSAFALARLIGNCIDISDTSSVLVAALGNPDITPDALGPLTAANILVTRHLKESTPEEFKSFRSCSLCRTGVLGTTGIESAAQIKILCDRVKPDFVIAVDALAGADLSRLCRTVQVCSTGIAPGSGIGNNRERLDSDFLSVPVIGIGMPTVIDASALCGSDELSGLFVSPRDIDSIVRWGGRLIAYGINLALHDGISISDIDMLVG